MIGEAPVAPAARIAEGNSRDLAEVMEVMESAFDARFGEAWTRSQCAGILPMHGVNLIVATTDEDAGRVTGFSLYRTVSDEAELLLLAVSPDYRRRGIGKLLLDHFMDAARNYGASRVHLEVREGNPALRMYRTAGFTLAGRRRKYYRGSDGTQFDALTLARKI
jgi:ribosomal-protein-alanine N-acetyltransferase